jgi:hypothetical protein
MTYAAASGSVASAANCGHVPVVASTTPDGQRVEVVVDTSKFESAPSWAPGNGDLPLAMNKTVDIALKWQVDHYESSDGLGIYRLALTRFQCSRMNDAWFYLVEYGPTKAWPRTRSTGNWVAILMDGSTVGPTTSK